MYLQCRPPPLEHISHSFILSKLNHKLRPRHTGPQRIHCALNSLQARADDFWLWQREKRLVLQSPRQEVCKHRLANKVVLGRRAEDYDNISQVGLLTPSQTTYFAPTSPSLATFQSERQHSKSALRPVGSESLPPSPSYSAFRCNPGNPRP